MRFVVLALWMVGCAQDVTQEFEDLANRACACGNKPCGAAVLADAVKLGERKGVTADEQRVAAAAKRTGECLLRSGVTSREIAEAIGGSSSKPTDR